MQPVELVRGTQKKIIKLKLVLGVIKSIYKLEEGAAINFGNPCLSVGR